MTRVTLPFLSANVTDATLTRWLKQPGDRVFKGEALAEITTEKATFDLESTADGLLLQTLAPERSMLPVGYIVALVGAQGETDPQAAALNDACVAAARAEHQGAQPVPVVADPAASYLPTPPPVVPADRVRATPKARRMAREQGVDLDAVRQATGAEVITEAQLRDYVATQPGADGKAVNP